MANEKPSEQFKAFAEALQVCIDSWTAGLTINGITVSSDAIMLALAGKIAERIATSPTRAQRQILLKQVEKMIRETVRLGAT